VVDALCGGMRGERRGHVFTGPAGDGRDGGSIGVVGVDWYDKGPDADQCSWPDSSAVLHTNSTRGGSASDIAVSIHSNGTDSVGDVIFSVWDGMLLVSRERTGLGDVDGGPRESLSRVPCSSRLLERFPSGHCVCPRHGQVIFQLFLEMEIAVVFPVKPDLVHMSTSFGSAVGIHDT
jgi:hypothetical protein